MAALEERHPLHVRRRPQPPSPSGDGGVFVRAREVVQVQADTGRIASERAVSATSSKPAMASKGRAKNPPAHESGTAKAAFRRHAPFVVAEASGAVSWTGGIAGYAIHS